MLTVCYHFTLKRVRPGRLSVTGTSNTYSGLHVKCSILSPDFNQTLDGFSQKFLILNYTEIRVVGTILIRADRQAGRQAGRQADRQAGRQKGGRNNSLIPFHSKRALLWRFKVACNNET
jgi:hypothetical protein